MSRAIGPGFGLERIGLLALARPRAAFVILACLAALIAISLPRVSFDDDIPRIFLSDSQLSRDHLGFLESQSPQVTDIAVLVTKDQGFSVYDLQAARDLALDLELFPGVVGVASPFVLRFPPQHAAFPKEAVFPTEFQLGDVSGRLGAFQDLGTGLPLLVTDALDALLIVVSLDIEATDLSQAVAEVRAFSADAMPPGVKVALTGERVISLDIVAGLKVDLIQLNALGTVMVLLAAILLLRNARLTVLAVAPGLMGAATALAMSVWFGFPLTVLSNVIPVLILVLGVADGLHLAVHLNVAQDGERSERIAKTVREVGPACALTAVTTSAAFCAIMLTGNAQLHEFAVLGAIGVLASFSVVMTGFVLLARVLTVSHRPIPRLTQAIALRLGQIGARAPKRVISVCAILLVLGGIGFSRTQSWFPIYLNLPYGSATAAASDRIAEEFGGVFQLWIEVPRSDGDDASDWRRLTDTVKVVEAEAGPGRTMSALSIARWLGDESRRPDEEDLRPLPDVLLNRLAPDGAGIDRIAVSMPEPMRDDAALTRYDAIEAAALENGAVRVVGMPAIMRHEAVALIAQLSLSLIAACGLATLIAALAFRSISLIPVLFLPNLLPILIAASSLHLLTGGMINPTAVLALTIAFGIAVDDTIHYLQRYRAARASGDDVDAALATATRGAGQVMVVTTLVLCCGLAAAAFSAFFPIQLFASMLIVTLISAVIVDLTLLPALLRMRGQGR